MVNLLSSMFLTSVIPESVSPVLSMTCDQLLTITISVLNIVTSVILFVVNSRILKVSKKKTRMMSAYAKLYQPLEFIVELLIARIEGIKDKQESFDIYSIGDVKIKDELIKNYYVRFVEHVQKTEVFLESSKLDKEVRKIYLHMNTVILTDKKDNYFNMDTYKQKYPTPDFQEFLMLVNKYYSKCL